VRGAVTQSSDVRIGRALALASAMLQPPLDPGSLPGAEPFSPALRESLAERRAGRAPSSTPRTRHLLPDGTPRFTNRLLLETSPYLLQHAHNPVNWYPWGDEAFEAARRLGRPVLLSIGYSTCHWCHVMEEECFEDLEIARYLNERYVAIKVDREERPDLDAVYISAVQALSGQVGWPLNVWLTPDREPFFGGTYFPPRDGDRGIRTGFLSLLKRFDEAWASQPEKVAHTAARLADAVRESLAPEAAGEQLPRSRTLEVAFGYFRSRYDSANGGLRGAPKFPSQLPVRFLLRYHRRTGDERALRMATHTLESVAAGGIRDHVGGGFHRYATDEAWRVPHFEKMLYDNALLALAYLDGHQATGREDFARVAREILRYVEREMTSPEGPFYSATDADSPAPDGGREEGLFHTWTPAELEAALGAERARIVSAYFGVDAKGDLEGRSVLHVSAAPEELAPELALPAERVREVVATAREQLREVRSRRPGPLRDEKVLAAWNGLMIGACARAALVLGEPAHAEHAARAARFVLSRMREGGRLRRSSMDGEARHEAYLEDYAFLIAGLLDLYEATGDASWLREALALDGVLEEHYEDREAGGYFRTSHDHEALLAREKPAYDGALPAGNSVQAMNLLRLHELTAEDRFRRRAEAVLRAFAARLDDFPASLSEMLLAADFLLDTPKQLVIVTPASRRDAEPFLERLRDTFLPNRILVVAAEGPDLAAQAERIPLLEGKVAREGRATAYVCESNVCRLPTTDPEVFARQIAP